VPVKQCAVMPIFFQPEQQTLEQFADTVAEIGLAAVELMWPPEDLPGLVALFRDRGVAVASMIGHHELGDGLNKVENHDRIESELRSAIKLAAENGIGGLICFSGNRNPGQSDLEGMVTCAHGLRRIVPFAEEMGVNLNMELLNSKVNHPGYQCDRVDWGVALCEMVNSPRCKLLFDIYHMQIMEGDLIRSIGKALPHIGHFHTAGNPGRHDLDDEQELNYSGICRAIAASGYPGYVGHEFQPKGDRLAALRQAFAVCDVQ